MTRSASKQELLYELGAVPVVADALDPDQVAQAVAGAEPEVIVQELTAIDEAPSRGEHSAAPRSISLPGGFWGSRRSRPRVW